MHKEVGPSQCNSKECYIKYEQFSISLFRKVVLPHEVVISDYLAFPFSLSPSLCGPCSVSFQHRQERLPVQFHIANLLHLLLPFTLPVQQLHFTGDITTILWERARGRRVSWDERGTNCSHTIVMWMSHSRIWPSHLFSALWPWKCEITYHITPSLVHGFVTMITKGILLQKVYLTVT